MAHTSPLVRDGVLWVFEGERSDSLVVGTPEWHAWLDEATSFRYTGPDGSFTARQEPAGRGGRYWKAYRRHRGKLYRLYLGRSAALGPERLRTAASDLAQRLAREGSAARQTSRREGVPVPSAPVASRSSDLGSSRPAEVGPAPEVPARLPTYLTSFVGRQPEIARIAELLETCRLLTLTGPGGVGKTRLAREAATSVLGGFPDGAAFVSLAQISDPALVAPTIAEVLGVEDAHGREALRSLKEELRNRRQLLVLDNFEHVADAAPVVAELLAASAHLKVIVTSRAVLHLYGEHAFPVPPLALPDTRAAMTAPQAKQSEAVQLFAERARAARPDFALTDENAPAVAELCRRLEGIPLAIELASARLSVMSLSMLVDRLERVLPLLTGGPRDAPARQQTLRQTIAWSHDLLDADEQALLRRLAVFRGGTLDAIEAVCCEPAGGPGSTSIALVPLARSGLDGVASLVEKSLLLQDESASGQLRYVMLEAVREYALERLVESGEEPVVRRRHVLHYLALAETGQESIGPREVAGLSRLEQEHNNLRAALSWCMAQGYVGPALRLAAALWWFWSVRGHISEGRQRIADLLERFPPEGASEKQLARYAQVLRASGMLALAQGDFAASRDLQEEGLELRRKLNDRVDLYIALDGLGVVACLQGDHRAASAYLEEALAIARALDNPEIVAWCLHNLGNVRHAQGDHAAARSLLESSMALQHELDQPGVLGATTLYSLAVVAHDLSDDDRARGLALAAVDLYRQDGHRRHEALALANLGSIATAQGDYPGAASYLGASLSLQRELGDPAGMAFVLERHVGLAAAMGQAERAVRLAAAATALRERTDTPRPPDVQARLDAALRPSRGALGRDAADRAWTAGSAMTVDEVIAEALSPSGSSPETGPESERLDGSAVLSRREREVAALIARGYTNRQIAAELIITEGTAANHVAHILDKLGQSSRSQVASWATTNGLLTQVRG